MKAINVREQKCNIKIKECVWGHYKALEIE